jgi:serine/threonine-protein kinase HipA
MLRATTGRRGERASFTYHPNWLSQVERFALEPALTLDKGTFYPPGARTLFGAFGDSAPDRWGRMLMQRAERRRAAALEEAPRTLHEWDYLLGVNDETRQGALRFTVEDGGPFVADGSPGVPPLVELPRLLGAARRADDDESTDEDLALLLAPGSSLGGARPKASVRDAHGRLSIAKFARSVDPYPVERWERVALRLAESAGIRVPRARVLELEGQPVLLVERFDRSGPLRVPFLSAMTMLGAIDGESGHSYPEIAEALRAHGSQSTIDRHELWRRMVFNVLIANTDDHLRNHGFVWAGIDGWRLSPAYDLNPTPRDIKGATLSTSLVLDGDPTASLDLALSELEFFSLTLAEAQRIASQVATAVATWRTVALDESLSSSQCDRMASAFEHQDLSRALAWA